MSSSGASSARAAILAIGTELTTGQITNRNAAWISEKLTNLGFEVVLHETVADDRTAIRDALDRCATLADQLFVTGGLGPTTDDFTREVIADWLGEPLEWHEPSWEKITSRLGQLGIAVAESNRQQCRFPRGATVLHNPEGTANGFSATRASARAWVLPGPPNEVAAVWRSNPIEQELRARAPRLQLLELRTWQCIGKSEAELGELTEKALSGSGLKTGYRAHRPYVEIKVWVPADQLERAKPFLEKLEGAIDTWVVSRQGADPAVALLAKLAGFDKIEVLDAATGGILGERLGPLLRSSQADGLADRVALATEWAPARSPREWLASTFSHSDTETLTLAIAGLSPSGECVAGLQHGSISRQETFRSPWPNLSDSMMLDRARRVVVELAIQRWLRWLEDQPC